MVAVCAASSTFSNASLPAYVAVVGPTLTLNVPAKLPSSLRPSTPAPGRHGTTRSMSSNALHTRSSGASTSKDCSSLIANRIQVVGGVDIAPTAELGALDGGG